jgi:dTDP-glucose pyrophosphorylase
VTNNKCFLFLHFFIIMQKVNILIPAAGEGSRFRNVGWHKPKPLIDVAGKPMIQVVRNNVRNWNDGSDRFICIVRRDSPPMPFECKTVVCDKLTEGAACTTLLAKDLINNDAPLLIANSDQFLEWDQEEFWRLVQDTHSDGIIVCFDHPMELNDTKWSYAAVDDKGDVLEVQEKKVISPHATTGLYYWRRGRDYVKYAEQMISKNIRVNNEFYVAPVYNEAIADGLKFQLHFCDKFWGLGTPADLTKFLCEYIRPLHFPVKLIAHRGNTQGPNPAEENKPEYLQKALDQGFEVETDVWYNKDGEYYLGHDEPQYKTTLDFLKDSLIWKHCKTVETLAKLMAKIDRGEVFGNSFFHQNDDVTLTSLDSLWTYPDKPTFGSNAIAVLPTNPHD